MNNVIYITNFFLIDGNLKHKAIFFCLPLSILFPDLKLIESFVKS